MESSNSVDKSATMNVELVMKLTNYTKEEAENKLKLFDNDHLKVIRNYMGLSDTKEDTTEKTGSQERYRLIREVIYKDNHNKQLKNKS
tara:strand:+ start:195 stop:458 length:264 start_codon:yes stop_codon:yes gene_type:complete